MLFPESVFLLSLVAGVCATLVSDRSGIVLPNYLPEAGISETHSQLDTRMASGVKLKDTKCPEHKIKYTVQQICDAVKRENARASAGAYNNNEKIFNTTEKLYKVSLDNVARAVFRRDAKDNYTYRGLIEHDKGLSNGFHNC